MSVIVQARDNLSKILLVACDQSYSGTGRPESQPNAALWPFGDTGPAGDKYAADPVFASMPVSWVSLLDGWTLLQREDVAQTGFGWSIFRKAMGDGTTDYIVAMQGTRGSESIQDWSGNLVYGWDKWDKGFPNEQTPNEQPPTNPGIRGGFQLIQRVLQISTESTASCA